MKTNSGRHFLFLNGELTQPNLLRSIIGPEDYLIGVDGGTDRVLELGFTPHIVIGDLDSILPESLTRLRGLNCVIQQYPAKKDETDLELALEHSLSLNPREVNLVSALGGRLDHLLGNALVLCDQKLAGTNAQIIDGQTRIRLVRPHAEFVFRGTPGSTFSLIPLADVRIRKLHGAEWDLDDTTLPLGSGRGLSNTFRLPDVCIQLDSGLLLLLQHEFF